MNRRAATEDADASASQGRTTSSGRASAAAARVAARYAKAPSYSDVLKREARAAVHAAKAAAQAAEEAQAAFQYVLDDLEAASPAEPVWKLEPPQPLAASAIDASRRESARTYRERKSEEVGEAASGSTASASVSTPRLEAGTLEPPEEPVQPIYGNLIEFPREMVAARRVRPRRAEGPLAEAVVEPQLSIFELDAAAISVEPPPATVEAVEPPAWMMPEWSDLAGETASDARDFAPAQSSPAPPATTREVFAPAAAGEMPTTPSVLRGQELAAAFVEACEPQPSVAPAIELAPFSRRWLAGVVDSTLIAGVFAGAVLLAVSRASQLPSSHAAAEAAAIALMAASLAYFTLFLLFAEATPGMRYAGVELSDFSGFSATRAQRLRRLLAMPLSILPLGLGLVWTLFDDGGLAWHDRLSATYLRRRS